MSSTTKIQQKGQVTIPTRVREQAGLSKGDLVEFSFQRGKIVITPKVVIDRSKFPNADAEYTPRQRGVIDAGIQEGLDDFKKGIAHGPFATAKEASAYIERAVKKGATTKRPRR